MKNLTKVSLVSGFVICLVLGSFLYLPTFAATTPSLGETASFAILSSTYTNTAAGVINGDLGYTTQPSVMPTMNGAIFVPSPAEAGLDQGVALTSLNSQPCTFSFAAGAIDLATDTTHGATGVYAPGVYCIDGVASIATPAGITLSGAGTYIFRSNGALNTVANSTVTLTHGASSCDIFWTPQATTLGADSTFFGTVIDNAGITVGNNVTRIGRALDFATTVTTNNDIISVPVCGVSTATLHVIKQVINISGGTILASGFILSVQRFGTNIVGSPASGAVFPGSTYIVNAGTYVVSEAANSLYAQSFTGDCNASGSVTLAAGGEKTCTLINTYTPVIVPVPTPSGGGGGGGGISIDNCPNGDYSASYHDGICGTATSGTITPSASSSTPITAALIGVLKVASPLTLPSGMGPVTYSYKVWNVGGQHPLTNVSLKDDSCSPVLFVSGDTNSNAQLDSNENWAYTCTSSLSRTTTNIATAQGDIVNGSHTVVAYARAVATVTVGNQSPRPVITVTKLPSRTTPFSFGGGDVTYTYTVKNAAIVPITNVTLSDDMCAPISGPSGDTNNNALLDVGEKWIYTCHSYVAVTTTNTVKAEGKANGFATQDSAVATVVVNMPRLPKTGLTSTPASNGWAIGIVGFLAALSTSYIVVSRKRKV